MGFSHSWIAVRDVTREQALEALGMEISDIQTDYLDGVALIDWHDNWLLAISDDSADAFDGDLARLAPLGPAIACSVQEVVMYSEARGYDAGKEMWRVVHDPNEDESLYSLRTSGELPQPFDAIVRKVRAEQDKEGGEDADVDLIFDIPAELAASICGFTLGESDPDASQYSSLHRIGAAPAARGSDRPGFFTRLFGRG